MLTSESIDQIAPALAAALAEMPNPQKNAANPFLKNKYADLGAVLDVARPTLAKHGCAVLQPQRVENHVGSEDSSGGTVQQTIILHNSGQWIGSEALLPPMAEEKGKSAAQVYGSAISYIRRYQLQALCGLAAEDDDGTAAGGTRRDPPQGGKQTPPKRPQTPPNAPAPPPPTDTPNGGADPADGVRRDLIASVTDGEKFLNLHPSHRSNKRKQYLGGGDQLDKATIDQLVAYLEALRDDARKAAHKEAASA